MDKYIFDEINGLWYPLSDTFRRRNTAYRLMGTTPQAEEIVKTDLIYI